MDLLDYSSDESSSIASTNNDGTALETRQETSSDDAFWMEKYRRLKTFHEANGHCNLPNSNENEQLLSWVADQRSSYHAGTLRSNHQVLLNALGFVWSLSSTESSTEEQAADLRWMERYKRLVAFKAKNGHMKVKAHEDLDLKTWINFQRVHKKEGKLRKDREQLLNQLKFVWSARNIKRQEADSRWMDEYKRLSAYKDKHGHMKVTPSEDKDLSQWIYNQRSHKRKGMLRKDREQLLDKLEFPWSMNNSTEKGRAFDVLWMDRYNRLAAYKKKNGHLNVKEHEDKNLNRWISNQRVRKNTGKLPEDREQLLNQLEFDWKAPKHVVQDMSTTGMKSDTPSESNNAVSVSTPEPVRSVNTRSARIDDRVWNANLQLLFDYKKRHGHTDVPRRGKTKELGQWLVVQNSLIERRKLSEDKATRLLDLLKVDTVEDLRSTNYQSPTDEESRGSTESSESAISWTHESDTSEIIQRFPVGTRIEKQFEVEYGKFEPFGGTVVSFDHFEDDEGNQYWGYMIHYDDGDREHMLEADVTKLVVETKGKKRGRPRKKETTIAEPCTVREAKRKNRGQPSNDDANLTKRQKKKGHSNEELYPNTNEERKAKAASVVVATGKSDKKESSARAEKKEAANQPSMRTETNDVNSNMLQQQSERKVTLDDFDRNNQVEDFVGGGAVMHIGNLSTENHEVDSESLNIARQSETEVENEEKRFDELDHEDERLASVVSPVTAEAIGPKSSTASYPNQKFAIGTPIVRMFFDMSDNEKEKPYSGKVTEYVYVAEEKLGLYFVQYDDGDTEFMEEWEIAKFSSSLSI
ncbi:hypothetical protein FisN_3Hh166 [Fistulifera solaris]|uniref:Helicase-associated domain-containing protein n=1 Tax=Fistulifera solaris TaxID=1519565 RepID=A0A1Z5JPD1_FISSO|nr:hypothetical protein FisN_3Hh166 [Fistulifera solaris]|eukprot:GAX15692.1 hypothetical protein FisN_3Hh166 [Fistulifera solaris]